MTEALYRDDPYLKTCQAKVVRSDDEGVVLDRTVFFAAGGGQPGDIGTLRIGDREVEVTDAVRGRGESAIRHVVAEPVEEGAEVTATLDWQRRHLTMRTHTALHLLYAALKAPVTGGRMDPGRGRLDFDLPDPPDREAAEARIAEFVAADAQVRTEWVGREYLESNPELVRTMAVKPPADQAKVSLVVIDGIDTQACGGTHVRSTAEVGKVRIAKVEKKGRLNRRVVIEIADG